MSHCDLCCLCLTLNYRAVTGIKAWVCSRNLLTDFQLSVQYLVLCRCSVTCERDGANALHDSLFSFSCCLSSRPHWVKPYVRGHIQWPRNFNKPTNEFGYAINLVTKFLPITYAIRYQSTKIKLSILIWLVGASHPHLKWDNISITRCLWYEDYDEDIWL